MRVVVDTNIAFSTLTTQGGSLGLHLTTPTDTEFYAPSFLFIELFKHKDRILRATRLPENDLLESLAILVESIRFIDAASIPMGIWMESRRLCEGIDLKDTPFVAMSLHLNAALWTSDTKLKSGLKDKGYDIFFTP